MSAYPSSLIIIYLLACSGSAGVALVLIMLIACPVIWSRDFGRRARAREVLRMLIWLLASRRSPDDLR
jgi:hypothetical protein